MGIDLGSRRIGVAVSDSDGRVATPLTVVERHRDRQRVHRTIAELAREWEVDQVVVGLPIDLSGQVGPAASAVLEECDHLATAVGVPVVTHDERMTTRIADRALRERGDLDGRDRRKVVDMVAASVILQDWLDQQRGTDDIALGGNDPEGGQP